MDSMIEHGSPGGRWIPFAPRLQQQRLRAQVGTPVGGGTLCFCACVFVFAYFQGGEGEGPFLDSP